MIENPQIWREVYEDAPDAIVLVNSQGHIVETNREVESLFGYTKTSLIGSPIEILIPSRYKEKHFTYRNSYIADPRSRPMGAGLTLSAQHKDGREIPVDIMLSPLRTDAEQLIICAIRDVTERRRADDALKTHAAELKRSNEELEQFAYVASHDLQEPLRTVAASCQYLEKRLGDKLDPEIKEFLGFAVDGALRMQELINDLLSYSRVSRSRKFKIVDTNKILERALSNLSSLVHESEAQIFPDKLPLVFGDFSQLCQLFQNLINNAIKFRSTQKPLIKISATSSQDGVIFAVSDNGIGIQQEYVERIFILFQRLHRREKYPGTGIGLAICKKIIETHHGKIWVESTHGCGSTFKFSLPTSEKEKA